MKNKDAYCIGVLAAALPLIWLAPPTLYHNNWCTWGHVAILVGSMILIDIFGRKR